MSDDQPDVRIPVPTDYDEVQAEAFRAGFRTCAQLNAQANQTYVRAAAAAMDDPESDGHGDEDERCDNCGEELVDAFGGAVCPSCDFTD